MNESAWIDDGDRRFIATLPENPAARMPAESTITRLIQGIYARDPEQARRILRHRIQATASQPTEMCWGMVRVAAKRLATGVDPAAHPLPQDHRLIELAGAEPESDFFGIGDSGIPLPDLGVGDPMSIALALAKRVPFQERRAQSARRIAAVLTDPSGKILAWALNSSALNKTLHAEVNLVQGYCRYARGPLPLGAQIHTTLKSCKMCAGMIWTAAANPLELRVLFAQDDPGPKARLTVLNAGSFERERAMPGSSHLLELQARSVLTNL